MTNILIIEDNREYASTLGANFRHEGYDVELAHTGAEGLERAKSSTPDLIVLDLMLPAMSGYSVLQRLRDAGSTTPVLVMTALGTEDEKLRGFALGADDYVVKPYDLRELLARIRAVLRRVGVAAGSAPFAAAPRQVA